MKRQIKRLFIWLGAIFLVLAMGMMLLWQWNIRSAQTKAEAYVTTLRTLIPEPRGAVPEERRDNTMSVLSLEGTDFVGILEMPGYASALPVGAAWGEISKYPCCYFGSVYDRTLQIGATTQKGQYDFYREICVGDAVYFTDLEGNRYGYTVTQIDYETQFSQASLPREERDLTLFLKNVYAFEYIVISCNVLS